MTAGIGVFNKQAAVLAGDSAATLGNGRKVFNTANKIFPLNKEEKIGLFIYNNSYWMGIPIEVILKLYKENEVRAFDNLEQYVHDFINFLEVKIINHIPQENYNEMSISTLYEILDIIAEDSNNRLNQKIDNGEIERPIDYESERKIYEKEFDFVLKKYIKSYKDDLVNAKCNLKDLELKDFQDEKIVSLINGFLSLEKFTNTTLLSKNIQKLLYLKIKSDFEDVDDFTGIVFAGYGKEEIFPSVYEVRIGGLMLEKVKFEIFGSGKVSFDNESFIAPFAQQEMASTFMEGLNPELENQFSEEIILKLKGLEDQVGKLTKISKRKLNKLFSKTYSEIMNSLDELKHEKMVKPVINTVSSLRKEDLVELAESLVGMTALKRKTTMEVETVGGPIDVAIITKDEGFQWVKRKEKIYHL